MISGMNGAVFQGLDYPALECVMRMKGVEDVPLTLEQVQCIETGALEVINKNSWRSGR